MSNKVEKFAEEAKDETKASNSNSAILTDDMKQTPFCKIDDKTYSSSDKEYAYCKYKTLQEKSQSQLSPEQRKLLESKEDIYTKSYRDGGSDGQLYSELFNKEASYILKNKLLMDRNDELLREIERLRRLIESMKRFSPERAKLLRKLLDEYAEYKEYTGLVEKLKQVDNIEDSINAIIEDHTERSATYIASYIEKVYNVVQYAISIDIQAIQSGVTSLADVTFSQEDRKIISIINKELNSLKLYIDGIIKYVQELKLYFHLKNDLPSNVISMTSQATSMNNTRINLLKSYFEIENIQSSSSSLTKDIQVPFEIQQPMKYPSLLKDEVITIGMTVKPSFLQLMLYFLLTLEDNKTHRFSFEIEQSITSSETKKIEDMVKEFQAAYMLTLQSTVVQGKKRTDTPTPQNATTKPGPGMVSIKPVLGPDGVPVIMF